MSKKCSPITRVALYVRVSTEEQRDRGISVDAQIEALQTWARENGCAVVDIYNDAGISARKPHTKRPELLRMLEDIRADRVDLVAFCRLDRWFRSVGEYYKVQEVLEQHSVSWVAIHEDYETRTASGRLKVNIMLSVAQDEADRDSERIKAVFVAKRARREPVSGNVPLGYRIEGKRMVKDDALAPAIDCYFEVYLATRSITRARDAVARQYGLHWNYQTADRLLRKPAYYGTFCGVEGMCPPYITMAQHESIISGRRDTKPKTPRDGRVYLFGGILFCGECGKRFLARTHRYTRRTGEVISNTEYCCPGKYRHEGCHNGVNIREHDIESYLLDHVEDSLHRWEADSHGDRIQPTDRDYSAERAAVNRKLVRLKTLYINELIEMDVYRADYDALQDQLAEIDTAQAAAETPAQTEAAILRINTILTSSWQSLYRQLSMEDRKTFWRLLLSRITINPDRSISFEFAVDP